MTGDLQLQQDVLDELEFEPSVNAAHIGVSVHRGVVTLGGFVESYAEKAAAGRAAGLVKGVKAIADEIEVRLPSDRKRSDDEIASRAIDILKWQVGFPAERIRIKVEKGVVTLSGDVEWQFQKTEAGEAVHKLTGVVGVINQIRVSSPVQAAEVKETIQKALHRNTDIEAARITVETEGGRVVLGGTVRASHEREIAERAAWSTPGVVEVLDRIAVEP